MDGLPPDAPTLQTSAVVGRAYAYITEIRSVLYTVQYNNINYRCHIDKAGVSAWLTGRQVPSLDTAPPDRYNDLVRLVVGMF